MPFAQRKFRIARTIALAGFTGDPNWLGTFDAAGAQAAGSITLEPTISGQVDILAGFLNSGGDLIDPGSGNYELEVFLLGVGDDPAGNALTAIYRFEKATDAAGCCVVVVDDDDDNGPSETLKVEDMVTLTRRVAGPTIFAFRVTDLSNKPGAATDFVLALRVG